LSGHNTFKSIQNLAFSIPRDILLFFSLSAVSLLGISLNPCSAGNEFIYLGKQIRPRSEVYPVCHIFDYEGEFTPINYINWAIF